MANKSAVSLAVTLVILCCPLPATATMELFLFDSTGPIDQVQIAPGESLQIGVGFATNEPTFGLNYILNISEKGSGKFGITDRVIPPGCPFSDLITENLDLLAEGEALLDPTNNRDLGAVTESATVPQPAGLNTLATITIHSAADVAPGTYTLTAMAAGVTEAITMEDVVAHNYTIVVADGSDGGGGTNGNDGTSTDGGTDSGGTDGTTDAGTGDQTDDGTGTGNDTGLSDTQAGGGDTEALPIVATVSRCGSGVGATAMMATMLAMLLVRPTGRRR
jgi:hypothetical protein